MPNEADTCRRFAVPKLQAAGWDSEPDRLRDQGSGFRVQCGQRGRPEKRADYILRYWPDMPIAVVEAKPAYATPGDGLERCPKRIAWDQMAED
jgi:type I restriction enzyme, R subunit